MGAGSLAEPHNEGPCFTPPPISLSAIAPEQNAFGSLKRSVNRQEESTVMKKHRTVRDRLIFAAGLIAALERPVF
jgi:hypothetical protein